MMTMLNVQRAPSSDLRTGPAEHSTQALPPNQTDIRTHLNEDCNALASPFGTPPPPPPPGVCIPCPTPLATTWWNRVHYA